MGPAELPSVWQDRAAELRPYAPAAAEAFQRAALELEAALREMNGGRLTLAQAAQESGYSVDRLRHMVADGTLPQAGRKGSPRIRRADLPRKAPPTGGSFDPTGTARRIVWREP